MIAAHRDVDQDWSEFETYATNLYVRSLLTGQPISSGQRQEASIDASSNPAQSPVNFDSKSVTDEMISMKKALLDLRTQSQEVSSIPVVDRRETLCLIDEPMHALDDGSHGTSEDVQRTQTEIAFSIGQ